MIRATLLLLLLGSLNVIGCGHGDCSLPCGANCCSQGATCVTDPAGNKMCATTCTSAADCPATGCCAATGGSTTGTCAPNDGAHFCMCNTGTDCQSGCCAPFIDPNGNPTSPYVCVQFDGKAYDCCKLGVPCPSGYCCTPDAKAGTAICKLPCHNASMCGGQNCKMINPPETCLGSPGACGPP
jgi:hypothetical protein